MGPHYNNPIKEIWKMNICKLFSKVSESKASALFNDIIGYNDVKRLFRMALDSGEQA